jgi:CRISPR-associated protein Csx3
MGKRRVYRMMVWVAIVDKMWGLIVEGMGMSSYQIELQGDVLRVMFGEPAQNDRIVKDAAMRLAELAGKLVGGGVLKINGPASMPVAFVLAHGVAHLYGAVAVYDPKLSKYVVCVTHDPAYGVGDLID